MRTKVIKFLGLLIFFIVSANSIYAQKQITGKVTDINGETIPGVSVVVKGTNDATITDLDGQYSLKVSDDAEFLVFSLMGMAEVVKKINSDVINATMESEDFELGNVIVIGYGTQKKSDKTGAVSQISSDELNQGVLTDPIQALQGKVAGVVITKQGGDPNAGFSVKIRGSSGLVSGTDPLYVIDGVPGVDPTSIAPEDIESFNVLKDASSTAIYGSRGANGVIIITTKSGIKNSNRLEISSYISFDKIAKRLDLLNADEIREYVAADSLSFVDGNGNTDWQDAIYRTGVSQSHNIAYSGGDENFSYRASLTHSGFKGVVIGTQKQRDLARMDMTQKALNNHLVISTHLSGSIEHNDFISYSGNGNNDVFYQTFQRNPTDSIYNADGTYHEFTGRDFNYYNPVALVNQIQNQRDAKRIFGNVNAELEIFKGFKAKVNLGYTRNDDETFYFEPSFVRGGTGEGFGSRAYHNYGSKILESYLTYDNSFGKSNITFLAGYSYQQENYDGLSAQGKDPLSDYVLSNNLAVLNKVNPGDISSYKGSNKLISFFGRATYNYDSKYYLTATIRRDGSSKFGINNEWGLFPSVSTSWNIKRESFLASSDFISDFKIRAGYGLSGNQEIPNYLDIISYGPNGTAPNPETGLDAINFEASHNSNPDLKWEQNAELNIGIDYGFFKNKISGSIDYYDKTTYDLLAEYSVPVPPNAVDRTYANVGTINNKGIEVSLQAFIVDRKNLTWKMLATFAHNKMNVISLSDDKYSWDILKVGYLQGRGLVGNENWTQIVAPGYQIGTFYMPEYAGISQDGAFLFYTAAGGVTRDVTAAERRVVGQALPKFTVGLSNYFTLFKNLDLSFALIGVYGSSVLNVTKLMFGNAQWLPNLNVLHSALDDKEKGINSAPIVNSYYLEDASYIRLDNLSIGYTFNTKNQDWIRKVRIYVSSNNLYTLTGYTGLDPEVNYSGTSFGLDQYNVYPKTRTLSFGFNVTF